MVFSISEQIHFLKESLERKNDVTKKNNVYGEKDCECVGMIRYVCIFTTYVCDQ